jgi:hypothetical protein
MMIQLNLITVFLKLDLFPPSGREKDYLLGPLEGANFNHQANPYSSSNSSYFATDGQ